MERHSGYRERREFHPRGVHSPHSKGMAKWVLYLTSKHEYKLG